MTTKKDEENNKLLQEKLDLSRDYRKVFGNEAGKRVLSDLMKNGYVLRPTENESGGNIHIMDRNEGKRQLVLYVLAVLKYNPEKFIELLNSREEDEGDHI